MTTLTSLARARAWAAGRAQPIATIRHVHMSDRPLVLVPLALAGEACAPLAAMVGDDPASPRLLVVAQPRNRDQRFRFAAELAGVLLPYIARHARRAETAPAGRGAPGRIRYADAPQILVPNRAGISFLRLLGRSTRFRRTDGDYPVPPSVPVLGRWLTFLADRSDYPGSCLMVAATEALATHWATGQSAVEDLNLAALAGWIDPPDGLTGPEAARAAEDPLRCPPAGPATDPVWDNEVLWPLIAAYDRAEDTGDSAAVRRARRQLGHELTGQLRPTWEQIWWSARRLSALPAGQTVAARWESDRTAFTAFEQHLRDGGPPQPRRDSAVAAARRLTWMERVLERYEVQRAYDDPLVMAEHRLTGEALAGRVTAAEPGRLVASAGSGRQVLRPLITVRTADPVLAERGTAFVSPSRRTQKAVVRSAQPTPGEIDVVLELSGGMGRGRTAAPGTVPQVGDWVSYAAFDDAWRQEARWPEPEQTPWTHGGPPVPYQPGDEEAREAWS